ncbi:TetR/AcrR family transcriptional regulator [Pseudonocardia nantongensis]|uniref:TetR/AcrR family transcriptional regulator n=1 Tax=Pseudonocardia nantongensis TaxID=1181885 RepID=UPI003979345A
MPARARTDRGAATRERILDAAEQLFAEHGVYAVSNRAIAEAADQGNNAVVGYHFGTKADLVRALVRRHADAVDRRREAMVAGLGPDPGVRDWVDCLVRPAAQHLGDLGAPTWYARFGAQIMTDPALRPVLLAESLASPSLTAALDGLRSCLPALPQRVQRERADLCRLLLVHHLAERERTLADEADEAATAPAAAWSRTATGLVDAVVGIWLAPPTDDSETRS